MTRAIVTGGAGLIGTAICDALAADGWEVASFDLETGAGPARQVRCDVADEASVAAAFDGLGWDRLDLLVNNAGRAGPETGPIAELSLAEWRRMTDSHLTAAFLMTRRAVPLMAAGGSIVNMTSTRAFMSEPETEAYAAAKGGLVALTHALAISLGPDIRANAIAPGWISGGEGLRGPTTPSTPRAASGDPRTWPTRCSTSRGRAS